MWNDHNFKKKEDGLGVLNFTLDVGELVEYDESFQKIWDNLGCRNKKIMAKLYIYSNIKKGKEARSLTMP